MVTDERLDNLEKLIDNIKEADVGSTIYYSEKDKVEIGESGRGKTDSSLLTEKLLQKKIGSYARAKDITVKHRGELSEVELDG